MFGLANYVVHDAVGSDVGLIAGHTLSASIRCAGNASTTAGDALSPIGHRAKFIPAVCADLSRTGIAGTSAGHTRSVLHFVPLTALCAVIPVAELAARAAVLTQD